MYAQGIRLAYCECADAVKEEEGEMFAEAPRQSEGIRKSTRESREIDGYRESAPSLAPHP
jgi:hypothetical protein